MKKADSSGCSSADLHKLVHDLRNRLNNIAMNAELAKLEIGTFDTTQQSTNSDATAEALACLTNILVACKESADVADAIATFPAREES